METRPNTRYLRMSRRTVEDVLQGIKEGDPLEDLRHYVEHQMFAPGRVIQGGYETLLSKVRALLDTDTADD